MIILYWYIASYLIALFMLPFAGYMLESEASWYNKPQFGLFVWHFFIALGGPFTIVFCGFMIPFHLIMLLIDTGFFNKRIL